MRHLDKRPRSSGFEFIGQRDWLRVFALLIGLWLVLRPTHFGRLFSWLRTAGQPKPELNEERTRTE